MKHFAARAIGLIVVPAIVYLFWFWVHFAVLTKSGTGDDFMSPAFQQTLLDSPLMLNSEGASSLTGAGETCADPWPRRDPLLRHDRPPAQGHQGLPPLAPGPVPAQVRRRADQQRRCVFPCALECRP